MLPYIYNTKENYMNFRKPFTAFIVFALTGLSTIAQDAPSVTKKDFKKVVGCWKASMNYPGTMIRKPHSASGSVRIRQIGKAPKFVLNYTFSDKPGDATTDTIIISKAGKQINDAAITSKQYMRNGRLQIVAEREGLDNESNQRATFRYTYVLGKRSYSVKKEIKKGKEDEWMLREDCKYTRKVCSGT